MLLSWDWIIKKNFLNLPVTYYLTADRMSLVSPPSSNGWTIPLSSVPDTKPDQWVLGSWIQNYLYGSGSGSRPFHQKAKKSRKTLLSAVVSLLNDLLSLKTDVNVSTVQAKNLEKNLFFVGILKPLKKGVRIRNPMYRPEDPGPYQNATDPGHCLCGNCSYLVPTWFVSHVAGSKQKLGLSQLALHNRTLEVESKLKGPKSIKKGFRTSCRHVSYFQGVAG
jgi:hypothetical protein